MDAKEGLRSSGVIVGRELVNEVVAASCGKKLGAVVEACWVCRIHDVQNAKFGMCMRV